jgi:hypothetical protein
MLSSFLDFPGVLHCGVSSPQFFLGGGGFLGYGDIESLGTSATNWPTGPAPNDR